MIPAIQDGAKPCEQVYSRTRCQAMVDVGAAEVSRNRGDVVATVIVPDPPPQGGGGLTLGGGPPIRVRIAFSDGTTHDASMCGLLSIAPACSNEQQLQAWSVVRSGYTDVPCAGAAPDGCATPHPTLEPSAAAAASPLVLDAVSIPLDKLGRYEIVLGEGSLPNGIVTESAFQFVEAWPEDVALRDGAARMEIRSLEPDGKPFEIYYMHGWRPGVERIQAVLTFDVLWFAPGATLEIRNVVVR
jgi:hypothetical protein